MADVVYYCHEVRRNTSPQGAPKFHDEVSEEYKAVVRDGDSIVPGEEISEREFIKECRNADDLDVTTTKQKHGADPVAPDRITDIVEVVETRAFPDGKPEGWKE